MTRLYYVEITCQASATAELLEEHLDQVMEALAREPGIHDGDIGASLATGIVDFCVYVDAEDSSEALRNAHVRVRSALHAAGGGTPGWDDLINMIREDQAETMVRPAELVTH